MKKAILLVIIVLFTVTGYGQKFKLKKEYINTTYNRLPNVVVREGLTYSVSVSRSADISQYYNESDSGIQHSIGISGRKRVEDNADMTVNITFKNLIITDQKIDVLVQEDKDDNGKVIKTRRSYRAIAKYSLNSNYAVNSPINEIKLNSLLKTGQIEYSGKYHSTSEAARKDYNANFNSIKSKMVNNAVSKIVKMAVTSLNSNYGYVQSRRVSKIYYIKSKKHDELAPTTNHLNTTLALLKTINSDTIPENIFDDITASTDYYNSLLDKYQDSDDKYEQRLRYLASYNLMTIFYLLEDLDGAIKYADILIENDHDPKDGIKNKKWINALKKDFEKFNITTLHFRPLEH